MNVIDSKLLQCQRDLEVKLEACEVTMSETNESKKNFDAISERIGTMASEIFQAHWLISGGRPSIRTAV